MRSCWQNTPAPDGVAEAISQYLSGAADAKVVLADTAEKLDSDAYDLSASSWSPPSVFTTTSGEDLFPSLQHQQALSNIELEEILPLLQSATDRENVKSYYEAAINGLYRQWANTRVLDDYASTETGGDSTEELLSQQLQAYLQSLEGSILTSYAIVGGYYLSIAEELPGESVESLSELNNVYRSVTAPATLTDF